MLQGSASQASRLGDLVMVKVAVAGSGQGGDAAVLTSSRVVLILTPLGQDQVGTHYPSAPEEHPWPPFSSHLPRTAQVKGIFIPGQLLLSGTCVRHCSQAQVASDQQNIESKNMCQKQD